MAAHAAAGGGHVHPRGGGAGPHLDLPDALVGGGPVEDRAGRAPALGLEGGGPRRAAEPVGQRGLARVPVAAEHAEVDLPAR
ncbi:MAG: hypothetical protein ACK559_24295, partial [bacterium]